MDLVERDSEFRLLEELLQAAAEGGGRCVLLSGEAGIGKSSLLKALARRPACAAWSLWWGGCDALQTPHPLAPLHDIGRACQPGFASLLGPGRRACCAVRCGADRPRAQPAAHPHGGGGCALGRRCDDRSAPVPREAHRPRALPARGVLSRRRTGAGPPAAAAARRVVVRHHDAGRVESLVGRGGRPSRVRGDAAGRGHLRGDARQSAVRHGDASPPQQRRSARRAGSRAGALRPPVAGRAERRAGGRGRAFAHRALARRSLGSASPRHVRGMPERRSADGQRRLPRVPPRTRAGGRRERAAGAGRRDAAREGASDLDRRSRPPRTRRRLSPGSSTMRPAPATTKPSCNMPRKRRARPSGVVRIARRRPTTAPHWPWRAPTPPAAPNGSPAMRANASSSTSSKRRSRCANVWVALCRDSADPRGEGRQLSQLALVQVLALRNADADRSSAAAIRLLEALPPSATLAAAYRVEAQLRMLDRECEVAVDWATRAIELAERFDDPATRTAAIGTLGTATLFLDYEAGCEHLRHALALALAQGDHYVARQRLQQPRLGFGRSLPAARSARFSERRRGVRGAPRDRFLSQLRRRVARALRDVPRPLG